MVARVRNGLLMGLLGYAEDLVFAGAPAWAQTCKSAGMYMHKQGALVTKATPIHRDRPRKVLQPNHRHIGQNPAQFSRDLL